jgi:hypothetical protein
MNSVEAPPLQLAAASKPAAALYLAPPTAPTATVGQVSSGNVLDSAQLPAGATANVTGFSVAGSSQVLAPGQGSVMLNDSSTGQAAGALVLRPDGSFTLTPAPGFVGDTPAIDVYTRASDGQTAVTSLIVSVVPPGAAAGHARAMPYARAHARKGTCISSQPGAGMR